jgi:F420-dependent oxidoreductase-like protein
MLEIAIMIEGQNGLTWPRWQRIVRQVEELGFVGLYRSDHFTNANPPDQESLELWVSLTWLAANTSRIEFGPMVTPFSFRHPAFTARMAAAVDDLSGGRLILGLGGGWQEREHHLFGFDLLDKKNRFARFEEGMECVSRLLQSDGPVDFEGEYFQLRSAQVLPRPQRPGGPPILVGGNGFTRTLALAARYAREWNANFLPPDEFSRANRHLDELLAAAGRPPESVRRSMMTGCIFSRTQDGLKKKVETRGRSLEALRERGMIVATEADVREQLTHLSEAGVQRVMLQWLELDDLQGLEELARVVL